MAQANPEILDNYDFDATAREYSRAIGAPSKTMATPERVMEKRKARAEAQAAQAKAQQMALAVEMANKGSSAVKNMSTSPVGVGSAMDMVTQKMQEAQGQ
jgi:hypothetical protein